MKSDFYEKQEKKKERCEELAEKNRQESEQRFNQASKLGKAVPMGQPILVGHHSEGSHRAHLKKIENNMRKGVEADDKAEHYERRAEKVGKSGISSDDPKAIKKLKAKLASMERSQEFMKEANKLWKKAKRNPQQFKALMAEVLEVDEQYTGKVLANMARDWRKDPKPFESYALSNNNGNMRRVRERIKHLAAIESRENEEVNLGGIRIVNNTEENRTQIFFGYKPDATTRTELKRNGFRWAPSVKAWQRHYSDQAFMLAKRIVDGI